MFIGTLNGFAFAALLTGWAVGAAPLLLLMLGIILAASIIAFTIVLAMGEGNVGCYLQGVGAGVGLYAILTGILGHYGVLGGMQNPQTLSKLLGLLLIPFVFDRISPSTPIQECI